MWYLIIAQKLQYSDMYFRLHHKFWHVTNNNVTSMCPAPKLSCMQTQRWYKNWLTRFSSEAVWACAIHISPPWSGSEGAFFLLLFSSVNVRYGITLSLLHMTVLLLRYFTFKCWPWCIVLTFNPHALPVSMITVMSAFRVRMFRTLLSWAVVRIWTSASLKG